MPSVIWTNWDYDTYGCCLLSNSCILAVKVMTWYDSCMYESLLSNSCILAVKVMTWYDSCMYESGIGDTDNLFW